MNDVCSPARHDALFFGDVMHALINYECAPRFIPCLYTHVHTLLRTFHSDASSSSSYPPYHMHRIFCAPFRRTDLVATYCGFVFMISQFDRSTLINILLLYTSVLFPSLHSIQAIVVLVPCSLIAICHVHFVLCGRNSFSILTFVNATVSVYYFFSPFFRRHSYSSSSSLHRMHSLGLALAVLVLLKLLNSYFVFLLLYFCFSLLYVRFHSLCIESLCCWYVFHKYSVVVLCFCFVFFLLFSSLHSTWPRIIITFARNFILFAVRLCFFIFTSNIIYFAVASFHTLFSAFI